jgi:hypothetical protein
MKSLKGAVLDWIVPIGHSLNPPIACNVKADHGFHHNHTGALLCPAGMDWADPRYVWFSKLGCHNVNLSPRIKDKLHSGEMVIPGDHWPVFLYAGYQYDGEDPWKGLFRGAILVSVSSYQIVTSW